MDLFSQPSFEGVRLLLKSSQLPVSDLTPEHMIHFFGLGSKENPKGVVGLELYGAAALLRSLAVVSSQRGAGSGSRLLRHAEGYSRSRGAATIYLLTRTAETFFLRHGYSHGRREDAPEPIRRTGEFSGICPVSSAFMVKHL